MFTTILALTGMLMGLGGLACGGYALTRARALGSETQALVNRSAVVNSSGVDPFAVRDVAVLHYDALKEMSGARSFSLALLNGEGDGVVVTSINGRTESRTYAKAIVRGESDTLLSPEEYRVVRSARLGDGIGSDVPAPAASADSADAVTPDAPAAPADPVPTAAAGGRADVGTGGDAEGGTGGDASRSDEDDKRALITVLQGVGESGHGTEGGRGASADGNAAAVTGASTADVPEAAAKHAKAAGKRANGKDARAPKPRSER